MTNGTPRRWVSIEEWEPGAKVEIIITGLLGEEQLQAIESFVARQRKRMAAAAGEPEKGVRFLTGAFSDHMDSNNGETVPGKDNG